MDLFANFCVLFYIRQYRLACVVVRYDYNGISFLLLRDNMKLRKVLLLMLISNTLTFAISQKTQEPREVEVEQVVQEEPKKEYLVCRDVCNWNDELVQYAREKTKDMDFILTITQESKWNWKTITHRWEYGLLQWTKDTLPKKEFIESQEFQNPYRQVDRAWEDWQRWIPYEKVINFQLKWYKHRNKRADYFSIEYK